MTSTTLATLDARRAALFARATDEVLFGAVVALERKANAGTSLTPEENLTRGWILGEIERRHPEVEPVMEAWAASDEPAETYTPTLMAAVAALTPPAPAAARVSTPRRDVVAEIRARRERAAASAACLRELAAAVPGRVHLQSIGMVPAIPAGDVRVGDTLMYNGGSTETVTEVQPKGSASVVIRTGPDRWQSRTCRRSTLVAVAARADT